MAKKRKKNLKRPEQGQGASLKGPGNDNFTLSQPAAERLSSDSNDSNERKSLYIAALVTAAWSLIVYLGALKGGFVNWDDGLYIYENEFLLNPASWSIGWFFTEVVAANWHPLTLLSYAFDILVFGKEPFGFHLTNIVLHAINSSLLLVLLYKLVRAGKAAHSKALLASLGAALLFALHPLHVESVAWISERKDLLYSLFFLLSLLSYLKYCGLNKSIARSRIYILCILFFALSLLSKPMAVTLPVVLLLIDFFPLKRLSRSSIIEKIPFYLLSIGSAIITVLAQDAGGALRTLDSYPFFVRLLVAVRAYGFYLYKAVFPTELAPLYPYPTGISIADLEFLGPLLLLILISAFSIWRLKRTRLYLSLWLYFLITLGPVIGIVQVGAQAAADRYMYMPSISLFLLAGLGVAMLLKRGAVSIAIIAVAGMLCSLLTLGQIAVWKDPLTLWNHEIKLYPKVAMAYDNRGNALYDLERYEEALKEFSRAVELKPTFAKAYYNRGDAFFKLRDYRRALIDYSISIKLNPKLTEAYYNRGTTYSKLGKVELSLADFDRTVELDPTHKRVFNNRGNAYFRKGMYERAIEDYDRAIEIVPDFREAYGNRGAAYTETGQTAKAVADYSRALEMKKTVVLFNNRGLAYMRGGRPKEALADFKNSLTLDPKNARAYYLSALTFQKTGDKARAKAAMTEAARLGSRDALRITGDKRR